MTIFTSILHTLVLTLGIANGPFAAGEQPDDKFLQTLPVLPDESAIDEVKQSAAEFGCIRDLEFDESLSLEKRASMTPDELVEAATWISECQGPEGGGEDPTDGGIQALVLSICGPWGCSLVENDVLDGLCCGDIDMVYGQTYSAGSITVTCLD